jgi:hypothetical protein
MEEREPLVLQKCLSLSLIVLPSLVEVLDALENVEGLDEEKEPICESSGLTLLLSVVQTLPYLAHSNLWIMIPITKYQ